jgi:hypothetical protein
MSIFAQHSYSFNIKQLKNESMKKTVIILSMMIAYAMQAQTVSLKLQLKEGQIYTMKIEQNSDVVQSPMGQEVKIKSVAQMTNVYKVVRRQDDQWVIEAQYLHIESQADSPTGKVSFGSGSETKDDLSLVIKALVNKPYTIFVTDRGRVSSITGLDEIFAALDTELASLSKARRKTAIEQMKAGFGPDLSKSLVEMCFIRDPGRELRTGMVWMQRDTTKNQGLSMLVDYQYKLDGFDQEVIRFSVMGTVQTDPANKPVITNGAEVKTTLYGSVRSKGTTDPTTGWVIEAESSNDISGNVFYTMGGNTMDIPIKMTSKAVIKVLK